MAGREHSADGNVEIEGEPDLLERRHPLAMVYGGGGVFGIAYGVGVAHGLARAGIDVAGAPALGTSAGSWAASILAMGIPYGRVAALDAPSVPTRRSVLIEQARELFAGARHDLVAASAVHLRSRRRHILDGGEVDLADLVSASSAVPGLFPPHRIGGQLYIDGGMWSATSVDAAANADHVIVIAPLAGPVVGPVGRTAGLLLSRELQAWRNRHPGSSVTMIRPTARIGKLAGRTPLGLFDQERAVDVYPLALEQGAEWGDRLQLERAA